MSAEREPHPVDPDSPLLRRAPTEEEAAQIVVALKQAIASLEQQVRDLSNRMSKAERELHTLAQQRRR